jgi:hypothetical protein
LFHLAWKLIEEHAEARVQSGALSPPPSAPAAIRAAGAPRGPSQHEWYPYLGGIKWALGLADGSAEPNLEVK